MTRARRWLVPWLLSAVASVFVATIALADAIPSPPHDCPRGSHGRSSHEGARCEPNRRCQTNPEALGSLDAPSGHCDGRGPLTSCESIGLCVVHRSGTAGRRFPNGVTPPHVELDEVVGTCDAHDHCAQGAHCNRTGRCVAPSPSSQHGHAGS